MNFVCIVFELGDKILTLSSMENLIVSCNPDRRFNVPVQRFNYIIDFAIDANILQLVP